MALGTTNITTAAVNTELGSPFTTPRTVKGLCSYPMNPYSFYGPWTMTTDSAKDASIQYSTTDYRLGDFRSYNHTSSTPSAAGNFTHNWGPGGTTTDITIVSLPVSLNVLDCDSAATYIRYNAYLSIADRAAQTSLYDSDTNLASFYAITPLTGHIRTQSSRIDSTHIDTFTGMSTAGLTTPNDYIYLDTFFSNSSGTRLVNLGSVSGGYTTITMHERQNPTITGGANVTAPSGWTAAWPIIHSASTPVCTDSILTETNGDTTYAFYLAIQGIDGAATKVRQVTSCNVDLKVDGSTQRISTGTALGYTSKTSFSGSLIISGGNFSYDEAWTVEVSNITYGAGETTC